MSFIGEVERAMASETEYSLVDEAELVAPLSANAIRVLEHRYLRRTEKGEVTESPPELFWRVARTVAEAETEYDQEHDVSATAAAFFRMMASLDFLPNSPTLMNSGTRLGQLSACFVLPVDDSMESIFTSVKATALIHQSGGGTGFSFSRLRPEGDLVSSTGGQASGPISFMRVFDSTTDVIKQGGRRRGANMAVLRVDHPDILRFIACKDKEGQYANFNVSVALTEAFLGAVEHDEDYSLINPRTGEATERLRAAEVLDRIVEHAWSNGEPGVIFLDRMNAVNPTPLLGEYESTNPCGEQVLLPYESCNLGSVNLSRMVTDAIEIDWKRLKRVVERAVRFMDDVITTNVFPLPQIRDATLRTRKIGLGVMGYADMLTRLGVAYDSPEAEAIARKIMEAVSYWSKEASVRLAQARGSFPAYDGSIYSEGRLPIATHSQCEQRHSSDHLHGAPVFNWAELVKRITRYGIRNATTTTIAPTGSISIIAGTSGGIEPLFALAYVRRHVLDSAELLEVNAIFERVARERSFYSEDLMKSLADVGCIRDVEGVPDSVRRVFVTAHEISPEWHVRMQAAFQAYTDNAVSKTINFPHDATRAEVRQAYMLAHELGCKGLTIYRDGSREKQVLNRGLAKQESAAPEARLPRSRPAVTRGSTEKVSMGCGRYLYVTVNEDDDGLCEVFLQMGKGGGCLASHSEAVGRLISLALRSGIDPRAVVRQLGGIRCPSPSWYNGGAVLSCADAIAGVLDRYIALDVGDLDGSHAQRLAGAPRASQRNATKGESGRTARGSVSDLCPECPDCGGILETSEGCVVCRSCGYSQCT